MNPISEQQLIDLKRRYSEPQRYYHTWAHIEALLGHFESIKRELHDPDAVLFALYWHDAIYDPQALDNEERSAEVLLVEAKNLIGAESLEAAAQIIRATKAHKVPAGLSYERERDLKLFLDMDLSILATPPIVYAQYDADIRAEYSFVLLEAYKRGRLAVLSGFLERERLYFSDYFYTLWEQQARLNLQGSIETLVKME